ncbi:MAG: hypothetical protein HQK74_10915, partial [Desulfamplus sp.]|nr:hypothetical protein [Desulfamplus sp.]
MITRELLKEEIDKVHEEYFSVLYKIIKTLESPSKNIIESPSLINFEMKVGRRDQNIDSEWLAFIDETYGSLKESPIKRFPQGSYEVR